MIAIRSPTLQPTGVVSSRIPASPARTGPAAAWKADRGTPRISTWPMVTSPRPSSCGSRSRSMAPRSRKVILASWAASIPAAAVPTSSRLPIRPARVPTRSRVSRSGAVRSVPSRRIHSTRPVSTASISTVRFPGIRTRAPSGGTPGDQVPGSVQAPSRIATCVASPAGARSSSPPICGAAQSVAVGMRPHQSASQMELEPRRRVLRSRIGVSLSIGGSGRRVVEMDSRRTDPVRRYASDLPRFCPGSPFAFDRPGDPSGVRFRRIFSDGVGGV